jgi:hypothetical protein
MRLNRSNLPVTNIKTFALVADPAFSSYHKSRAVTARVLQMDHDEIFLHWVNGFSELQMKPSSHVTQLIQIWCIKK